MTNENLVHRGIALAGLVQSADLVNRLASHGQIPDSSFELMRSSLFKFDVERIEDIYLTSENLEDIESSRISLPEVIRQNLHGGLRVCEQIFEKNNSHEYEHCIRYFMALIQLEKHFNKSSEMQKNVRDELQAIHLTRQSSSEIDANISVLYVDTLATLPFRIQVLGKMEYLQNLKNEHRIRVILFAGLRAAMLWRQHGGRRWHFLLNKNSIKKSLSLIKTS